jgi:hypothetical protein
VIGGVWIRLLSCPGGGIQEGCCTGWLHSSFQAVRWLPFILSALYLIEFFVDQHACH